MKRETAGALVWKRTAHSPLSQIITSRGCINECNFCYRLEKKIRFRSIQNVLQEMKILYDDFKVRYFVIQDELFVANKKR